MGTLRGGQGDHRRKRRVGSFWLLFFALAGLGFAAYTMNYAFGRSRINLEALKVGLPAGAIGLLCLAGFLRPLIGRGLAWVLILAGIGGPGFFVYSEIGPDDAEDQERANRDYMFYRLYRVCYGGSAPDAAELTEGEHHPAVFFSAGLDWSANGWRNDDVRRWIPSSMEEAELVVCEWREDSLDDSMKGEGTLMIHQARTGQVVAQFPLPAIRYSQANDQILQLARGVIVGSEMLDE